jgi:hypothetical protein
MRQVFKTGQRHRAEMLQQIQHQNKSDEAIFTFYHLVSQSFGKILLWEDLVHCAAASQALAGS